MSSTGSSLVAPVLTKATAEESTVLSKLMELLFSDQKELLTCICTQMLNEGVEDPEQTHYVLMNFYNRLNCALPLMKWAVSHEFQIKGIETSLFRGTTPAMRLLPAFYHLEGHNFLELCLSSFVHFFSRASVTAMPPPDPDTLQMHQGSAAAESSRSYDNGAVNSGSSLSDIPPPSEPPPPLKHRQSKYHSLAEARLCIPIELRGSKCSGKEFCDCVEALLEHIFNVIEWCPINIRRLYKYATEEAGKFFPEQRNKIVSIFLYLRFIAPALASPEKYGLIAPEEISEEGHKTLFLASRIIQWLANGAIGNISSPQLPFDATERLKTKELGAMRQFELELIDIVDEDTKIPRFASLPGMDYNSVSDIVGVIVNYQNGITRQLEKEFSEIHATMFKRIMALVHQKIIKKHSGKGSSSSQFKDSFVALDTASYVSRKSPLFTPTESDDSLDVLAISHLAAATNAIYQLRHERALLEGRLREQIRQEYAALLEDVRSQHAKEMAIAQQQIGELEGELHSMKTELKAVKRENKKLQQLVASGTGIASDEGFRTRRRVMSNAEKLSKAPVPRIVTSDLSNTILPSVESPTGAISSPGVLSPIASPGRLSTKEHGKHKHRRVSVTSQDIDISPPPLPDVSPVDEI